MLHINSSAIPKYLITSFSLVTFFETLNPYQHRIFPQNPGKAS
jgi:hypothetical protein